MNNNNNKKENENKLKNLGEYTIYLYIFFAGLSSIFMTITTLYKFFNDNKDNEYIESGYNKYMSLFITLILYVFTYYIYNNRDNDYVKQFTALMTF